MLGGAATHFSLAASFFTEVRPVGPVGDDFGAEQFELLEARGITHRRHRAGRGRQELLLARPLRLRPQRRPHRRHPARRLRRVRAEALRRAAQAADTLFLANIQPDLQRQVRAQCGGAGFSGLDSMNLWIEIAKDSLLAAIAEVDCVVVNDAEIRMLTGESNLARAARAVMAMGPRAVVAKQGEYGAALFTEDGAGNFFALPGFPLEDVRDPTGAGDSFAGGFFGYLDGIDGDLDEANLRRAMGYGTVLASFNVEEFGTERVSRARARGDRRALRGAPPDDPVRGSPGASRLAPSRPSGINRSATPNWNTRFSPTSRRRRVMATEQQTTDASAENGVAARDGHSDRHRQPHRQDLRAADHRRHDPRARPASDQGRRGRIRDDVLRPGLHQHRLLPLLDHLHRRRRRDPRTPRLLDRDRSARTRPSSRSPTC